MCQKLFSYGSGDSHIHSHSETYVVGTPAVHTSRPILLLLTSVQSDRNPNQVEKKTNFLVWAGLTASLTVLARGTSQI